VKFLLDTSLILWSVAEEHKLNARATEIIGSRTSVLHMSAVSAWEIAIKYDLGDLPLHAEPAAFIPEVIRGLALQSLNITPAHAIEAERLPHHHRDPFDRMLIAQANVERMTLLTADRIFGRYKVDQVYCGR
jgi:PIN domain nuclease of toxin-antitoxin system